MAQYAKVIIWRVRQFWQVADIKPHRLKTFKISNAPDFAEKVIDTVGLYMDPPNNALFFLSMRKYRFSRWTGRSRVYP